MPQQRIAHLPAVDRDSGDVNAVVEAVRGSRNKFKFDEKRALFVHDHVLPAGASYPFDFGFIPSTRADDGDPLDVLILMEEPAFVGAVVPCRLVGAIEAEQTERDGTTVRNDRLLGVASKSHIYRDVRELHELPAVLIEQVEHFWVSYNEMRGRVFTPLRRVGARAAKALVKPEPARRR
jgi:inorganic pyrophosphatase